MIVPTWADVGAMCPDCHQLSMVRVVVGLRLATRGRMIPDVVRACVARETSDPRSKKCGHKTVLTTSSGRLAGGDDASSEEEKE